jgi:hypothetical protein
MIEGERFTVPVARKMRDLRVDSRSRSFAWARASPVLLKFRAATHSDRRRAMTFAIQLPRFRADQPFAQFPSTSAIENGSKKWTWSRSFLGNSRNSVSLRRTGQPDFTGPEGQGRLNMKEGCLVRGFKFICGPLDGTAFDHREITAIADIPRCPKTTGNRRLLHATA